VTRFSDAAGRQVVSTSTAETLGQVEEFILDPQRHVIAALRLKKTSQADTLLWTDITAFGADAVTVAGVEKLATAGPQLTALGGKDHRVLGKRVLSTAGDELGTINDVEFDPETGTVTALVLVTGDIAGIRLIGIGSYAVIVHRE
jgi:uncharacterized protein YrrD